MLRYVVLGVGCSALALASPVLAEPQPKIGPAPAWVEPVNVPQKAARKDLPVEFLVTSSQDRLTATGVQTYFEYVVVPRTTAGLQAVGTITVPWNAERTDLTLHRIAIRRADQTIDLLKPADLLVLRRENNLEKATLDGLRTVVLPAKGLRIGDQLVVAASYVTKPSEVAFRPEDLQSMTPPEIMTRVERRFIVPNDVRARFYRTPDVSDPAVKKLADATEYRFVSAGTKPREYPVGTPARYKSQFVQFSGWADWGEIATRLGPLFDAARKLPPSSGLAAEADEIAASTKDLEARLKAALRLSQEQVRYVALLLGEGAYRPSGAEETWERRFGDCKGKTALLLALLDRLGIDAAPMLVSMDNDDGLTERLPSLALFDHVIVRARLGGKTYYLDPTNYGQRTLDELSRTDFQHGLVLEPGAKLSKLESSIPGLPLRESELVWDGSQGFERSIPFTATLTLRGELASEMRAKKIASSDTEEFSTKLKDMMPGVSNDDLVVKSEQPEEPDGSYTVHFAGTALMDWSPLEGMKGYRYEFDHSVVKWDVEFKRDEENNKNLPVVMQWPFYQRATETIILPKGGKGFKLDAKPIDEHYAGVHVSRTIQQTGDRVIARSEFIHESREIAAADARAASSTIQRLNDEFAYVVAPGRIKAPKQETASK